MKIDKSAFLSIEQLQNQYLSPNSTVSPKEKTTGLSFGEILQQKAAKSEEIGSTLKFSKHAANRLMDRNITLSDNQMERLNNGTKKAGEKGIQESLVIVDELAFIVNIPNKTVITAMDQKETSDNIFTNIDGAVIM